jgi:hypothetical protein
LLRRPPVIPAAFSFENLTGLCMLHCNISIAAMQTRLLALASGIPRLPPDHHAAHRCPPKKGTKMSKTASASFAPSSNIFARLVASIDRFLAASARIAVRNGDLPYFGL